MHTIGVPPVVVVRCVARAGEKVSPQLNLLIAFLRLGFGECPLILVGKTYYLAMAQPNEEGQEEKHSIAGADAVTSPGSDEKNGIGNDDNDVTYLGAKIFHKGNVTEVYKRKGEPEPYPPKTESYKENDTTLFIGISAFRDPRCPKTLYNLFTKAKYPDRVTIGVVQQWKSSEDDDCLEGYCSMVEEMNPDMWEAAGGVCPHYHQVKMLRLDYRESLGPCYARHFQSYMLRDEEFCTQLDSHMDAILDWDTELMDMWGRANNEYGILSVYVNSVEDLPQNGELNKYVPHLCEVMFTGTSKKEPRFTDCRSVSGLKAPLLSNAFAGGFNFGKCHSWKVVPYDPGLKRIFNGEEFSMASRLWVAGYDFYTPDRVIIGHHYNTKEAKAERKKTGEVEPSGWVWNDKIHAEKTRKKSYDHLWKLLGIGEAGDPSLQEDGEDYGLLCNRRKWHQLQEYIGVNLTTLERFSDSCKHLEWVPFVEGPWPPTINNLQGQYWEEKRKEAELLGEKLEKPVPSLNIPGTASPFPAFMHWVDIIFIIGVALLGIGSIIRASYRRANRHTQIG